MNASVGSELDAVFEFALPPYPYPGLRPFGKREWPIFFGRERMTDEVIRRLTDQQFLVVHGDSGCGKSSLIRAGVLPRLEQQAARGGKRWVTCTATPGDAPLKNLARALAGLDSDKKTEVSVVELRRMMNCGRDGAEALTQYVLHRHPDAHVCILLDQFEELFAHARRSGPQEAALLVDLLIGLQRLPTPNLWMVLTMRSEFLGACAQFEAFAESVNVTQYLLPRMSHTDLLRAIRDPALLYDGEVSLDLAERLIDDAGSGQDELPLIQHALMVLHRECLRGAARVDASGWVLTLDNYRVERGLSGLLSDHADEVMNRAEQVSGNVSEGTRVIEDLFRALTDINADGHAIRRPKMLETLIAVTGADEASLRRIIDVFRAEGASFLRPYGTELIELTDYVDISHEALIRCWRRLADEHDGWLIREFKNGLVWRSLIVQADSFDQDNSNVLSTATTEERRTWLKRRNAAWSERYGGQWERVCRLIEASVAESERRKYEEEEERRRDHEAKAREQQLQADLQLANEKGRRERLFRAAFRVVAALLVMAAGLAYWAYRESRIASEESAKFAAALEVSELRRNIAEERSKVANETIADVKQTTASLVTTAEKNASSGETTELIEQAQGSLKKQLDKLKEVTEIPPRIYIHIADETQRAAAADLQLRIAQQRFGDTFIYVPGVELKAGVRSSVLRCFQRDECQSDGKRLLDIINGQLVSSKVDLQDLSERYARTSVRERHARTSVRERHFELWFASGDIVLRSAARDHRKSKPAGEQ